MRTFIFILAALTALTSGAQAEQIWLTMDHVRPYKLENPVQSIIIGNPAIADVTVQDNQNLLLFGKSPGLTNIYMLNDKGEPVENLLVRVRTQSSDMLTFYRGIARTTYNCTDNCEATVTVGDADDTFASVVAQVQTKYNQASRAADAADKGE